MVLYIDHYDSFAYMLVDYIKRLGCQVEMIKTDQLRANFSFDSYSHLIIGPGPGHPSELINLSPVIRVFITNRVPILGVCLGHQLLAQFFGGVVKKSDRIIHGQCTEVFLTGRSSLFYRMSASFCVTRYHSLLVEANTLPSSLMPLAYTKDKELMAFQHQKYSLYGLQYHPEAYLTEHGLMVLRNFLVMK